MNKKIQSLGVDHADTIAQARIARNMAIHGGIGTPETTTIVNTETGRTVR